MTISERDWSNYIRKLRKLSDTVADKVKAYIERHGLENTKELIDYSYALVSQYGEGAAALSAQMYDILAELEGRYIEPAEMAPTATYGEVAKSVNGTLKTSQNPNEISGAVSRWVKMAGSDTTLKNAERDGAQFAWIPSGDTCAFCLTLASRGWQNMSKAALKHGHAEHIHSHCDCQYAVRFDSKSTVAGYDPDRYRQMYYDAEGDTPQEKINAMRRAQYEENKDMIKAQKRAAYAERKQKKYLIAAQSDETVKVPENMKKNYEDYEELNLSDIEIATLKVLHKKGLDERFEYGKIIYNEGETDYITQKEFGTVKLPVEQTEGTGLIVLHCHTNDTPPSSADFAPFVLEKVDKIGVISNNGDTWVVDIGYGIRPTKQELDEAIDRISNEVRVLIQGDPEFSNLSPEEKSYMVIREKFYRITREFGWKAMGGDIDDI